MGQQAVEFKAVSIIGVDKQCTRNPNPQKLLYDVYLKLSTKPPNEWATLLEQEHRFPRSSMWRSARVEGEFIVLHCPLEETAGHLEYLKQDVQNANEKYVIWLEQELARQKAIAERQAKEEQRKNNLLDSLKFD